VNPKDMSKGNHKTEPKNYDLHVQDGFSWLRIGYSLLSSSSSSLLPHLGACSRFLEHRAEFPQFLNQGQSVGLLGWVISSSQDLYLYANTEKHTHIHKH
jgi:hypothetical protein